MKAARIENYGAPLRVEDVPIPTPGPGQILIEVKAAAVNPVDWKIAAGYMQGQIPQRMPLTLGCEIAGLDPNGNRVYGYVSLARNGGYAEYAVAETSEIAPIPEGMGFAQAASIPVALFTAHDGLVTHGQLQKGERVLVLGGAGGVGSMAVQIAKSLGAFVYATASARNQDRLKELGADVALDYGSADLAKDAPQVDLIFDSVGGDAAVAAVPALKPGGRFVSPTFPTLPAGVDLRVYGIVPNGARLAQYPVATLQVHVDREFPLAEAADAVAYSQTGRARGKIVLIP